MMYYWENYYYSNDIGFQAWILHHLKNQGITLKEFKKNGKIYIDDLPF